MRTARSQPTTPLPFRRATGRGPAWSAGLRLGLGLALGGCGAWPGTGWGAGDLPTRPAELFEPTRIWTVHLKFAPQEWKALEPVGGPRGFGGPPRPDEPSPRREGGPPGRGLGGPPGNPGEFGPGLFLGPAFLNAADADRDGQVSREEFRRLGETWFDRWDTAGHQVVTLEQLRAGLNATLGGNPPAGGPGGPGGPRGGLNLQGREGQRNGLAAALGIEFPTVPAELEFEGVAIGPVMVRYKGNGTFLESRGTLKRSFKVDLNDNLPRLRLAGVTKLNLHNCVTDPSWMNEVLAYRLFRDFGVPAPRTAYARVFLTVPGEHHRTSLGLYSLVENPDRNFAEAFFGTRKGALFKPVTKQVFEDLGDDWRAYRQTYDPKTPVAEEETRRVIAFCKLVSHADDARFAAELGDYLDLEAFARFMAVTVWLSTLDSILGPGQNYLVHLHPVTRRLAFIPWDLDHAFGQFPLLGTQQTREQLSLHRPWLGESRFLERVFAVPAFKERYLARLAELNRTVARPERLQQQVDELAAVLRPAVAEESDEKRERFDRVVAGEAVERFPGGFGGGRRPGGMRVGFGQPPQPIKAFAPARWQSVEDQLAGRSAGQTLPPGFGPGGGPGRTPGRGGPGGPPGGGDFGPGQFLGPPWMAAHDANRDGRLTRAEAAAGFARWFAAWDADQNGQLSDGELRTGLNRAFARPFPDGPPGPGGPGRAGGPPSPESAPEPAPPPP